jgi:hypothetical protein
LHGAEKLVFRVAGIGVKIPVCERTRGKDSVVGEES